jgi:protein-L-isoaspartate(D-aspartate) O-methyltransferase
MTHPDFQTLRVKMVDGQLRTTDVTSHDVLSAFLAIPREIFVRDERRELAYLDDDIQIAPGRYMMEPSPLAKLLQLANISATDKVLIIGSASGYSAAVVANIAVHVVALESDDALVSQAKANMSALNIMNVECMCGPLQSGAPSYGPFNVVLIEGAVGAVPATLMDQLTSGGRLVAVEGQGLTGIAQCYLKSGNATSASRGFNLAVKPLPGFESAPVFSF